MPPLQALRPFPRSSQVFFAKRSATKLSSLNRTLPQRPFSQYAKTQFRWNAYEPPPKDHPAFQAPPRHPQRSQRPEEPQRLNRLQWLQSLWRNDPRFRFVVIAGGTGYTVFILYNVELVPETGRRRFNCISQEQEIAFGKAAYEQTLNEYRGRILPAMHPHAIRVRKVLNRLLPATGLQDQEWEVHVIEDGQANAFVIPG